MDHQPKPALSLGLSDVPLFLEPYFHQAVFDLDVLDAVGEAFPENLAAFELPDKVHVFQVAQPGVGYGKIFFKGDQPGGPLFRIR